METEFIALAPRANFRFDCGAVLPCFNTCCRDLHQALTPYDVLRLRGHLGLGMVDFLSRHGQRHTGPSTGMPVVTLRPLAGPEKRCPFVTDAGCRVYPDRPSSCRVYPLARILRREPAGGTLREEYLLLREPHCQGFDRPERQSVQDYVERQELAPYNRVNDHMVELIGLRRRNRSRGTPSTPLDEVLFVALYDLECLRSQIQAGRMPDGRPPGKAMILAAGQGDEALLLAAMDWLKQVLMAS